MKEQIHIPLALIITCLVSALFLSFTYAIAQPKIEETEANILQQQLSSILAADNYEKLSEANPVLYEKVAGSTVEEIYLAKAGNVVTGSIFLLKKAGYNGDIRFLVGFAGDRITKVAIFTQAETPGLGTRIENEEFLNQFIDKQLANTDYDTITGATISSSTVINTLVEKVTSLVNDLSDQEKQNLGILENVVVGLEDTEKQNIDQESIEQTEKLPESTEEPSTTPSTTPKEAVNIDSYTQATPLAK